MSTPSTRNITRAFRLATDADREAGMEWYREARSLALSLTGDLESGAGILAALSPLTSWAQNIVKARQVVETGTTYGLPDSRDKAIRILAGEHPSLVLSGPKVTSFYANILGNDTPDTVTVDRHAIDIACWKVQSDSERARVVSGKRGYRQVAELYIRAARILSKEFGPVTASQVQAVTWTYWRKNHAAAYHG